MDITLPIPRPSGSYDAAFASHVAEHVPSKEALGFFTECHRILKPNGWLRISIPVIGPWLGRRMAIDLTIGHGHMCCYNEELVRTFLWMAGFDQEKIRRVDRDDRYDHHHLEIGEERDYMESCRMLAVK